MKMGILFISVIAGCITCARPDRFTVVPLERDGYWACLQVRHHEGTTNLKVCREVEECNKTCDDARLKYERSQHD